jgi:hypothetical protein
MTRRLNLFVAAVLAAIGASTLSAAPFGYSVQSNGDDHLYLIDLATGVAVDLGALGFGDAEGLASDGVTLWAIGGTVEELWDITVPPGFKIGDTGARSWIDAGLAYNPADGKLYNLQGESPGGSTLYEIDAATGAATLIGADPAFADGLAIDPSGVAYAVDGFSSEKLYTVDLATGALTEVGSLGVSAFSLFGLAFDASGQLWGINTAGDIYAFNTATGSATYVAQATVGGVAVNGFEGLDCMVASDVTPPEITVEADPTILWPANHKIVAVEVSGAVTDDSEVISPVTVEVDDEYGQLDGVYLADLAPDGSFMLPIELEASRRGPDRDGRTYTIWVSAMDEWGNQGVSDPVVVLVAKDTGKTP